MAKNVFSRAAYVGVRDQATQGGTKRATSEAEERLNRGEGLNPLVDPRGPSHLGPIRRSLARFEKQGDLWLLACGMAMAEETLLDTTGSMGNNVELAFESLPRSYDMVATGKTPVLGRYDPQIATSIFNDTEDHENKGTPVLCRTQFEMDEKIAIQMTHLTPGRGGCGNGKEDPQFGLFGAAYLTAPTIVRYGLKWYHFTVSDEPVVATIDLHWLQQIFGNDVLDRTRENGYTFNAHDLPDTAQVVCDLQAKAHAFFLWVGERSNVRRQWTGLYGEEHFVKLPPDEEGNQCRRLDCVKATIIGLTEGVLDLRSAVDFLHSHSVPAKEARQIVAAVQHIPLGAQAALPNFSKLPKAGDLFRNKTDLWPINGSESESAQEGEASAEHKPKKGEGDKPKPTKWL